MGDAGVEVVICGHQTQNGWTWGLPKGTPDQGETLEETALREVREETGLRVRMEAPIDSIRYWFVRPDDGVKCHKTVHFYLMVPTGGDTGHHDPEFDVVEWFAVDDALVAMAYDNEVDVLRRALVVINEQKEQD